MKISALLKADFSSKVKNISKEEESRWRKDQATAKEWSERALKAFRDLVPLAQALGEGKADKKTLKTWAPPGTMDSRLRWGKKPGQSN